jgi:hypothetical protein
MILTLKSDRPDSDRGDVKYRNLDLIAIDELAQFTVECLNRFGNEEDLQEANEVADVMVQMLRKKKILTETAHQSFVDVLLVSALLHNLFYEEDDWSSLFFARQGLLPVAEEMNINSTVTDAIFQTIEGQLGEDTPVPMCKPAPNSPTELFATAVWFVKEYAPQV